MPVIEISERDILRGKIVQPAWYRVRIDSVGQKMSAAGTSTNFPVEGTIMHEADSGAKDFSGVPTPAGWNFNDKAIGFAIGFLEALGLEIKPGMRVELKNAEGKEVDVFIENGEYEGRTVNRINHKYRKPRE
jgi:hypothetical protein